MNQPILQLAWVAFLKELRDNVRGDFLILVDPGLVSPGVSRQTQAIMNRHRGLHAADCRAHGIQGRGPDASSGPWVFSAALFA